jgi:hypothetical protein
MSSRQLRLPLLLLLAVLTLAFLATEREAFAGTPTCTTSGTGFHDSEEIRSRGQVWCGSICDFQNTQECRIGTNNYTWDCVDNGNGTYSPTNVQVTQYFCQFCPNCGYICCG